MKLGTIAAYLQRAGRAKYVTERPRRDPQMERPPVKFCKDCKHYTAQGQCHHPSNFHLVTGNIGFYSAEATRYNEAMCGTEGRWFEAPTGHLFAGAPAPNTV